MTKKWYVVHTLTGKEFTVKKALENEIENAPDKKKFISSIFIPTEKVAEVREGEKKISERKFFPGYILIEMELNDKSWYLIKNTPVSVPLDASENTIKNPFVIPGLKKLDIDPRLNPENSFDNFIEGECNRLARSAGYAVSKNPGGTAFNPLLVYGDSGLGKTHLAQAIGI